MDSGKSENSRRILITAIIVNVAVLTAILLFFYPSFETNDDSGLLAIVGGSRGIRDPHMVHSNYLLGLLLVKLFELIPTVQWTAVLQYVVLLFSFISVTYVMFKRFQSIFFRIMIVIVMAWFAYEGYVRIQYTKTAGMVVAMGLLVVFSGLLEEEVSIPQITGGLAIVVAGSFCRMQQFYCEIAIFTSMVVYLVLVNIRRDASHTKRLIKSLAFGMLLLLIVFSLRMYDRAQYRDSEWSEYLEFDKYRTEVIDYGVPNYDEYKEEYNAIGIDKTAYNMMKSWNFQDSEKFTADTFRAIAGFKKKKNIDVKFIKGFVKGIAKGLTNEGSFLCFVVIAAGWLILGKRGKIQILTVGILALIILSLYMYLFYAGRFMVHRVDVGIWFAASLIVLYLFNPEVTRTSRWAALLCIAMILLFLTRVSWTNELTWKHTDQTVADNERNAIEEVNKDQNHIYLTKVGTLSLSKAYGAFDAIPFGIANNIYPLGGWGAETPVFKSVLQRYGITNPMRDMIDNDMIYLVDNNIENTIRYLQKWYNADSRAIVVDDIEGKEVYRIVTN